MCAAAILNAGFELFLRRLSPSPTPLTSSTTPAQQAVFIQLQERAEQYYRGEVWPLRRAFGVLLRFINGVTTVEGKVVTPSVVTT